MAQKIAKHCAQLYPFFASGKLDMQYLARVWIRFFIGIASFTEYIHGLKVPVLLKVCSSDE